MEKAAAESLFVLRRRNLRRTEISITHVSATPETMYVSAFSRSRTEAEFTF